MLALNTITLDDLSTLSISDVVVMPLDETLVAFFIAYIAATAVGNIIQARSIYGL
jgi:hypothetical protein